jgi:RNA recognition motif-containing protein
MGVPKKADQSTGTPVIAEVHEVSGTHTPGSLPSLIENEASSMTSIEKAVNSAAAGSGQPSDFAREGEARDVKEQLRRFSQAEMREERRRELVALESSFSDETSVFVRSVHHDATESEVMEAFSRFGKVNSIWRSAIKPQWVVSFEAAEGKENALSSQEPITIRDRTVELYRSVCIVILVVYCLCFGPVFD